MAQNKRFSIDYPTIRPLIFLSARSFIAEALLKDVLKKNFWTRISIRMPASKAVPFKYPLPTAPSIRVMTSGTDNPDDEMFAKLKYQKVVWRLMNEENEAKE